MARKKSRMTFFAWILFTVISGGGVGGYMNPDWPIIGPLIKNVLAQRNADQGTAGDLGVPASGPMFGGGNPSQPRQQPVAVTAQLASSRKPPSSLLLASFNIQVLGKSKMSKPGVVEILAHVIRQFDVVAIQEIRSKDDDIIPSLVAAVNADGSRYSYLIGPRLGRTVSTEQYAFIYDTLRIEHDPSTVGTITDPSDMLHREPFVARFRARTNTPDRAFTFWLVNTHTDPDEVPQEVSALADVFQVMQTARPDEDDVILLGDLNASESQLGRLGAIPGIRWVVSGAMTNTRQTKAYDNILFHSGATSEFTGRWGVYDLERTYGLSRADALKISDHLPVWAEFQVWEGAQGRFADRPGGNRR